MKRILLLLALCMTARADVFSIESGNYNDGTHFVGAYNSLLNGQSVQSFCIDLNSTVAFHQNFNVTVINLANFTGAQHDNYERIGWLALQSFNYTDTATISAIQRAIWLFSDPGTTNPYLTTDAAFYWVLQAQQHVFEPGFDSLVTLYLSDGPGQSQISVVPETSVSAMIVIGFFSLLGFLKLGRDKRFALRK